jgi:hypothetical protein
VALLKGKVLARVSPAFLFALVRGEAGCADASRGEKVWPNPKWIRNETRYVD